ncbi:MAG: hypothetical protein O9308_11940 [Beijerinckiaceae bacterium]|nr:hypothetical protein [Beijerinckiaceae bacterium]
MTNRVHIDAPAGVIEIEGEKEFVEGLLARLFPLIEASGFGNHPKVGQPFLASPDIAAPQAEPQAEETLALSKRPARKAQKQPPAGQSCAARILTLKGEGYFKEHRTSTEIVAALKTKGWTHTSSQVSAATINLFGRQDLQRTTGAGGKWVYYWDRD